MAKTHPCAGCGKPLPLRWNFCRSCRGRPPGPNLFWVMLLAVAVTVSVVASLAAFLDHDWPLAAYGIFLACIGAGCIRYEQGKL